MDRRFFLKSSGIALASFGFMAAAPDFLHQFANAQSRTTRGKRKILITIFQRGAVDGLNMAVPYGDPAYYDARRTIAIPKPGANDGAINLDGYFGLHPSLAPFESLWNSKQLAVIHAAGSPNNTRSHFDAQDYMESGTPGNKGTVDGWLNRVLQTSQLKGESAFRAVAMTQQTPRTMMGRYPTIAMSSLADFAIKAGAYTRSVQGGFEDIYQQNAKDTLGETGKETFEAVNYLKKANPAKFQPENGAQYPNSQFGQSLKQIAQLIKADVGLETAFTEVGGWDTHTGETATLRNLLRDFGGAIKALTVDLGNRMDDVMILTMSEFGRTVRENGGRGTDHGHGNVMFAIGGGVKGGKIYGDWKGLKTENLYDGRDLAVTTDFRDVFAEVASRHLGNRNLDKIFPGFTADPKNFRGLVS